MHSAAISAVTAVRFTVSDGCIPSPQVVKRDGSLAWSPIYLFPHFQTTGEHNFVRITTESNATVCSVLYITLAVLAAVLSPFECTVLLRLRLRSERLLSYTFVHRMMHCDIMRLGHV